ncbi:MAG: beta-N-acetylhexosaminidase [Terriglobales bacterium]
MSQTSKLNLRAQAGQTMILGFDGVEMSARLRRMLQTIQPAGVILFARNIREPRQTWDLLRECQRCVAARMFLCVDMEGGTVDRLRDVVAPAPSVAEVAASKNRKLFRQHGHIVGQECRALGFNTDFAPVLDLAFEPSRTVLTSRTASSDPVKAVGYAREFLRGLRDAGVLGCGKHFPGLGEAELDTHHKLAIIKKPWKRLWEEDLYPYCALHRQMPFIMVAHAAYSAVTLHDEPASVSRKWISGILRKRIGYHGLIVSDDLEMGGVQAALSIGDAAVATLKAGVDLFLVCHSEAAVWECYEKVVQTAERTRHFAARVTGAASHVLAMKKRHLQSCPSGRPPSLAVIERLRRGLWELSEGMRLARLC